MFLLLSQITKVLSRGACPYLTRWNGNSLLDYGTSWDNSKWFYSSSTSHWGSHTYERVVLQSASIERNIGTDIYILSNCNLVSCLSSIACYSSQVLNCWILADSNGSSVSSDYRSMPEWWSFSESNITNHSGVWSYPITLKISSCYFFPFLLTSRRRGYLESEIGTHLKEGTLVSSWPIAPCDAIPDLKRDCPICLSFGPRLTAEFSNL